MPRQPLSSEDDLPQVRTIEYAITTDLGYETEHKEVEEQETVRAPAEQEGDKEQVVSEYESADDEEQEQPLIAWQKKEADATRAQELGEQPQTMSPEEILLLQVLKRAKRNQNLITEIQKSLKVLTTMERDIGKTRGQVKQMQSAIKDTQKQIKQINRQIETVERKQERNYQRLADQMKKVQSGGSKRAKAKSPRRRKKTRSRRR